jgi:hypothetical protein
MPVDISGAVTATYEATINVPLDGEYANSAALQDTALALANRVEYLRQGQESGPWREARFFDDFLAGPFDLTDGYLCDLQLRGRGQPGRSSTR